MKCPFIFLCIIITQLIIAADMQEHDASYYHRQGQILRQQDRLDEAVTPYQVAVQLEPKNTIMLMDLANTYHMLNRNREALETYQKILEINPNAITALYNFGFTLKRMGYIEEPLSVYEKVLALNPDHAAARFSRSTLYLTMGDLINGFKEYEWRFKAYNESPRRFNLPLWQAEDLSDHTLLVYAEQGLGDTIQFVRFVKQIKEQYPSATIILEAQEPLVPLLKQQPYLDLVIARGEQPPQAQYQIPLMSIPRILGTTLQTIPHQTPYVHHSLALAARWKKRLESDQSFKVGICWHGNAHYKTAALRKAVIEKSVPLVLLQPLTAIEGVTIYSLQHVTGEDELTSCPFRDQIVLFDSLFDQDNGRFMDTAAVMQQLDLVITVDTSTAHLAGALNVPTWIMLPFPADWRWLCKRKDSPWYPSVRLFQQRKTGEWQPVIEQIVQELSCVVSSTCKKSMPWSNPTPAHIQFFKQILSRY